MDGMELGEAHNRLVVGVNFEHFLVVVVRDAIKRAMLGSGGTQRQDVVLPEVLLHCDGLQARRSVAVTEDMGDLMPT